MNQSTTTTSNPVKIRVLIIVFENSIAAYELPAFRGAVSDIVGSKHILFHNHLKNNFRYSYPLIQYKRIGGKPALLCIEDGVDEVHHFFEKRSNNLLLGEREYELRVEKINLNQFVMQTWDRTFRYRLQNWLPLNQNNYKEFKNLKSDIDRMEFLNNILFGNILSFAKGINWHLDKEKLQVRIHDIEHQRIIKVKKVLREAYTLEFSTNAFLPNQIGLGKNASLGFGVVWENRKKK